MGNDSAGPGSLIGFGSEITGDPRLAGEREWLVTNGLGGYAMGTVLGAPSRSYHGLLIAALSPPVGRTLLVSRLEVSVAAPDGSLTSLGHRQIEAFALEGTVPCWRYAVADTLLEKRVWMAQGANTTYVSFRLVRGAGPLELMLTAFVQLRSHHGGGLPLAAEGGVGAGRCSPLPTRSKPPVRSRAATTSRCPPVSWWRASAPGAADREQRGFVDAEDLHTYVSRRVVEAAPAMTPQCIPTREGHRIVVCKVRRDPTVAYRQEVEKRVGEKGGVISPAGRALLDDPKRELALPQPAAEAIEAEVLQPFRAYAEKLSRYQQALEALAAVLPAPGAPLSPVDQEELALREKRFKLRRSDKEALHRRLGISFGEPEAALSTRDADPPAASPILPPQEGPSAAGGRSHDPEARTPALTEGADRSHFGPLETATLRRAGSSWEIQRRLIDTWGFREPLAEGVGLELVAIPAGSFLMGSPADEPERAGKEGPQHEVQLEGFFSGQTPITQAQWQVVAGWRKVQRDLDPDPSRFKGANRPVQKLSGFEAVEFCRRLSRLGHSPLWVSAACCAGRAAPDGVGPGLQRDRAAAARLQSLLQVPAEALTILLAHGRQSLSGARSGEQDAPELLEAAEGALHREGAGLDVAQAGGRPELLHHVETGGLRTGRHGGGDA